MEEKFLNLTLKNDEFNIKTNVEIPDSMIKEIVKIFVANVSVGNYEVNIEHKNY